jgi:leucine-rich repeat protein SHOC2
VPYALCLLTTLEELRLKDNNELFDPPYPMVEDPQLGFKAIMKYLEAMHLAASLGSLVLSNMKLSYFKPNEIRETTLAKLHWRLARAESKTSDHAIRSPEEAEQIRRRLQIKNLETLSLDSNEFEIIPQEIFFFSCLTHLSLANNMLMDLPPEIGRLTSLTVLAVDDNKLESLPSQMSKLFRMKKITFSNNNLEFIPEVIMEMTRLQILTLSNNRIEKLPDELPPCLPYLRVLSLNKNRLTSVPPTIASLRHIVAMHLADNDIITLPPTISACNQLKAIYLSNNPLPHVPLGLLALHSLEQLRMSGTFVTGLPVELGLLTALKDLRLDNTERLIWPSREIVDEGLEKLQEYLLDHYDLTTMDVIEDDESAYDMLDQAPVTRDSLLAHIDKVQEILEEVQLCHQQISALKKMRVKQVRIGNKTNIEDIDNQVAEITERMQWFTADVVQLEEMRNVETDIMLVQAELDQLELEWG